MWINFWEFRSLEYAEVKVSDNQSGLLILLALIPTQEDFYLTIKNFYFFTQQLIYNFALRATSIQ